MLTNNHRHPTGFCCLVSFGRLPEIWLTNRMMKPTSLPSFAWTRNALVERYGEQTYVYGRWDRLFGCWQSDGRRSAEPFTPLWPLLDRSGQPRLDRSDAGTISEDDEWLCQELQYYDRIELETYWDGRFTAADDTAAKTDADAHFQSYIELIPIEIRRMTGAFGPWQWVVLSMIWEEASFADFLRDELRAVGPGFVASCLALARPDKLTREERDEFRRKLMFTKRAQLVSSLVGCNGSMVARWLRKLHPDETLGAGLNFYLFAIANDPVKAQVASHIPALTFSSFEWLEWLPPWVCSVRLLGQLSHHAGGEFRDYVLTMCRSIENNYPERKAGIARALRGIRDVDQLIDLVELLTERFVNATPFPPAPLRGDKRLQPLTSARMMRSEGHWMRNCVGGTCAVGRSWKPLFLPMGRGPTSNNLSGPPPLRWLEIGRVSRRRQFVAITRDDATDQRRRTSGTGARVIWKISALIVSKETIQLVGTRGTYVQN